MFTLDDAEVAARWERIASRSVEEVSRASGASWDGPRRVFRLDFLKDVLELAPDLRTVTAPGTDDLGRDEALLALWYLADAREVPLSGKWVSGHQLPGGAFFFRGPHVVPSEPLAQRFGSDPDGFRGRAKRIGGVVLRDEMPGDAAARFRVFPRVDIVLVLWTTDDEFPARVSVLFDATITEHLRLDGVLHAAGVVVRRLVRG
jgi:hypothetical protein